MDRQVELKERDLPKTDAADSGSQSSSAIFEKDALTVVVEEMLSDAGFTPVQTQSLLEISLSIARGMAAERFLV